MAFTTDLYAQLRALAAVEGSTLAGTVRRLIVEALAARAKESKA